MTYSEFHARARYWLDKARHTKCPENAKTYVRISGTYRKMAAMVRPSKRRHVV